MNTAFTHRYYVITCLSLLFFAGPTNSTPIIPAFAESRSAITLTAEFKQTSFFPYFAPSPITAATTRTFSTAFSTYPESGHLGTASSEMHVSSPDLPEPIANVEFTFDAVQSTSAMAITPNPAFAKAVSLSRGSAYGIIIPDQRLPAEPQPSLKLTWNLFELSMRAETKSAFSMIRHTVDFTEQGYGEANPNISRLGFNLLMADEHNTITAFNTSGESPFYDWFEDNIAISQGALQLVDNPTALSVEIPLADSQFADVSVRVNYLAYSAEAPPGATPQVAEKAGFIASDDSSAPLVRWSKDLGMLSFDNFDANVLSNRNSNEVHSKYAEDPLIGGQLQIDPLFLVGKHNNRLYFSGEEARMVDSDGNIRFRANLPSVVFEEDLASGQDFNLFAPILDIIDLFSEDSKWMQDFQNRAGFDSPYLPELFVALNLDATNSSIWEEDFAVTANAALSFTGPPLTTAEPAKISEPDVTKLVATGFFAWFAIPLIRRWLKLNRPIHS